MLSLLDSENSGTSVAAPDGSFSWKWQAPFKKFLPTDPAQVWSRTLSVNDVVGLAWASWPDKDQQKLSGIERKY
jgi:hypothetical protein